MGGSWLRGVVCKFGGFVFLQGRPNRKMSTKGVSVDVPGGVNVIIRVVVILKFHRVFSSYGHILVFARGY